MLIIVQTGLSTAALPFMCNEFDTFMSGKSSQIDSDSIDSLSIGTENVLAMALNDLSVPALVMSGRKLATTLTAIICMSGVASSNMS